VTVFAKRGSATQIARPAEVRVYRDRIEERRPRRIPGREITQTIRFDQVAQVAMKRGLMWSSLVAESTGGHQIVLEGLPRKQADEAKAQIESRIAAYRRGSESEARAGAAAPTSAGDELARLADLRGRGALTDEEFAAAKRSLLGL